MFFFFFFFFAIFLIRKKFCCVDIHFEVHEGKKITNETFKQDTCKDIRNIYGSLSVPNLSFTAVVKAE